MSLLIYLKKLSLSNLNNNRKKDDKTDENSGFSLSVEQDTNEHEEIGPISSSERGIYFICNFRIYIYRLFKISNKSINVYSFFLPHHLIWSSSATGALATLDRVY